MARRNGNCHHVFSLLNAPSLTPSHLKANNPILDGVRGGAPDPETFRCYMANRAAFGHIPTLLKDWVTAHAGYRAEALAQVRAWVAENRHLFRKA